MQKDQSFFLVFNLLIQIGTFGLHHHYILHTYHASLNGEQVADEKIIRNMAVYTCEDGSLIPNALVCNGRSDCKNSEDERVCSVCSTNSLSTCFERCTFPNCRCNMLYYQCQNGGCVHYDHVCDSFVDCAGGDDESACHQKKLFYNFNKLSIKKSYFVNLCDPPIEDMLMCKSKPHCYNSSAICHYDHGDGVMAHCEDGSHLGIGSFCWFVECPRQYKCSRSYCIPSCKICDGIIDCPTGDDETSCVDYKCPGHMRCSGVTFCVPPHEICDGVAHCPRQDDEKYCQICPSGCNCKGTAIHCQDIKNLTLNGNLQPPSALILHKSFEVFIELYNDHWLNMQYVLLLALEYGSFGKLPHTEIYLLSKGFFSVKVLYLNHQGLKMISAHFITAQHMTYFNLTHNAIHAVKRNAFALTQSVKILSLAYNKLQTLFSHFTSDLKCLSHLFLSGNRLKNIPADIFRENVGLVMVRSDWYVVCCVVIEVKDCEPQNQFVSSCSHLIASVVQKTFIMLQGYLVIISNVEALVIQYTLVHSNITEKYLIKCLTIADLMMGIYLLAIANVNLMYSGTFHNIISEWNNGIACILFGLINFISSEISLIILSLLSFVRVISVDKLGGMSLMKSKIRKVCICIWLIITFIGLFYIVYVLANNMELRNNMCIFFGLSHQRLITNFELSFQVAFICFNVLLLTVLSVSMFGIMRVAAKSSQALKELFGQKYAKFYNTRLRRTCFKLSMLFICNVLTWLPFLIVSISLLSGIRVHENVLQWVIVLGISLCSTADPILYNIAALKSYLIKK